MPYTWEEVEANSDAISEQFKWLFFYDKDTITPNTWMGTRIQKNPLDLFIYAEILHEVKPKLVIETGTFYGGSAIFWADLMALIHGGNGGKVISIDPAPQDIPETNRNIEFIRGSSTDDNITEYVSELVWSSGGPVLVNLDSLHDKTHVLNEMEIYHRWVTPGSYMIVEDGIINGHPTHPEYGPGPYEACEEFLANHPEFIADRDRERMMITANPLGFLKKIKEKRPLRDDDPVSGE